MFSCGKVIVELITSKLVTPVIHFSSTIYDGVPNEKIFHDLFNLNSTVPCGLVTASSMISSESFSFDSANASCSLGLNNNSRSFSRKFQKLFLFSSLIFFRKCSRSERPTLPTFSLLRLILFFVSNGFLGAISVVSPGVSFTLLSFYFSDCF